MAEDELGEGAPEMLEAEEVRRRIQGVVRCRTEGV